MYIHATTASCRLRGCEHGGADRQPLLAVILSLSVYLSVCVSVYVCVFVGSHGWVTHCWLAHTARLRVYIIYFPVQHCAGVINMSPYYNLSPLWRYIADIGVWDL